MQEQINMQKWLRKILELTFWKKKDADFVKTTIKEPWEPNMICANFFLKVFSEEFVENVSKSLACYPQL